MKKKLSTIALLFALLLTFATGTFAQNTEIPYEEPEFLNPDNQYALLTAADISSTVYNIDHTALLIRGIAKNTTVEAFLANITGAESGVVTRSESALDNTATLKTGDILTVSGKIDFMIEDFLSVL